MKHSYESTSEFIKELIEMTQQGSHVFNGMMSNDRVIGYLQAILLSIEPIEEKSANWDLIQWAIENQIKFIAVPYDKDKPWGTHINNDDIEFLKELKKEK